MLSADPSGAGRFSDGAQAPDASAEEQRPLNTESGAQAPDGRLAHTPVMVAEVLAHLAPAGLDEPGAVLVDGTVGLGGHAEALLEAHPTLHVLGLDRDPEALALATPRLARFGARVRLERGSYADLAEHLTRTGWAAARGVLLDLGVSSLQLDAAQRGFSFSGGQAAADMRFDALGVEATAADFVNHADERELADALHDLGGEPRARAVARALVRARPLHTVGEIAAVARRHALRTRRIDAATRTFQALRMAVNDELGHLARGLAAALASLGSGGRLVVLAFHSGEERCIKQAFREASAAARGRVLTKKPVRASASECRVNPRARSARLRAFEVAAGSEVGQVGRRDEAQGSSTSGRTSEGAGS